jgi:selenocysteine lyase/cysteine desulfurase
MQQGGDAKMLSCQKHLFSLEADRHYINCAYMSPLMQSVEAAGIEGMRRKRDPFRITVGDFFNDAVEVKKLFATLIHAESERIALLPSASYGLGIVTRNLKPAAGGKIIAVHEEFPSDVYSLYRACSEYGLELVTIKPPETTTGKGRKLNEMILEAIDENTVLVNLSSVHWSDGTVFDLEAIGKRTKEVGALFVVDGSQSVGAAEINVKDCNIDALICAGYKWLLGPYTSGFAYFSEYFDEGKPIEESWMSRIGREDFKGLVDYNAAYHPKAARYDMGEFSNFINLPMLKTSLTQILEWAPANITAYCDELTKPLIKYLAENGFLLEEDAYRSKHIFGFRLPGHLAIEAVGEKLAQRKVTVSLRGSAVRVSPHLYNDEADMQALMNALEETKQAK